MLHLFKLRNYLGLKDETSIDVVAKAALEALKKANEMETVTYEQMVTNLAKDGADILVTLTPEKCHILHMAIGLAGEDGELLGSIHKSDTNNTVEECGDIEFYLEGLKQSVSHLGTLDIETRTVGEPLNNGNVYNYVNITCSEILDIVKKYVIYNQPDLNLARLQSQVYILRTMLTRIYSHLDCSREHVLDCNMKKLLKGRYKDGQYSDEAAKNREDKQGEE